MIRRLTEATLVGAGGALVGGAAGSVIGLGLPAACVACCNGLISGWRGIYDWRCSTGIVAAVLDSSWAIVTTSGALGSHLIAALLRGAYVPELSARRNRHVYRGGFSPRRGFAVTVGNTISGAGDVSTPTRRHLVDRHEEVHIWQSRILGPGFVVMYLGWLVIGAALGLTSWVRSRLNGDRSSTLWSAIDRCAYWNHPLERQANLRASRANQVSPD